MATAVKAVAKEREREQRAQEERAQFVEIEKLDRERQITDAIRRLRHRIANAMIEAGLEDRNPRHIEAAMRLDARLRTADSVDALTDRDYEKMVTEYSAQIDQGRPSLYEQWAAGFKIPEFVYVPLLGDHTLQALGPSATDALSETASESDRPSGEDWERYL